MIFDKTSSGGVREYQIAYINEIPIIGYRSENSLKKENLGINVGGSVAKNLKA